MYVTMMAHRIGGQSWSLSRCLRSCSLLYVARILYTLFDIYRFLHLNGLFRWNQAPLFHQVPPWPRRGGIYNNDPGAVGDISPKCREAQRLTFGWQGTSHKHTCWVRYETRRRTHLSHEAKWQRKPKASSVYWTVWSEERTTVMQNWAMTSSDLSCTLTFQKKISTMSWLGVWTSLRCVKWAKAMMLAQDGNGSTGTLIIIFRIVMHNPLNYGDGFSTSTLLWDWQSHDQSWVESNLRLWKREL